MRFIQSCIVATTFGLALAAPLERRQGDIDGIILNYALTLEYLEAAFYKEALANYTEADFEAAGFVGVRENIVQIGGHEQTHATFLFSILLLNISLTLLAVLTAAGITPTKPCIYSFPVTDVTSFLGLAQVIEGYPSPS